MTATIWTILGVIGTALAGAVIGKLVTIFFDRSAQMVVDVTINQSFEAKQLREEVREFRKKSMSREEQFAEPYSAFDKYNDYFSSEAYVRFIIKNNSKKKITGLSFCLHKNGSSAIQIGEGELQTIKGDKPFLLGDLQPKREIVIHLLLNTLWESTRKRILTRFSLYADELGRVKYRFPLPPYIKARRDGYVNWVVGILFIFSMAFWIVVLLSKAEISK